LLGIRDQYLTLPPIAQVKIFAQRAVPAFFETFETTEREKAEAEAKNEALTNELAEAEAKKAEAEAKNEALTKELAEAKAKIEALAKKNGGNS
jgi:chromosome segregation ATPase